MKFKAVSVAPDCDWITQDKVYQVPPDLRITDIAVCIIDDKGLKTTVYLGEAEYLNEYVKWEII